MLNVCSIKLAYMELWNDRLFKELEQTRLRPSELAQRARVTAAAVSQWKSLKTQSLDMETLIRVCKVLRLRPEWLVTGKGQKYENDTTSEMQGNTPQDIGRAFPRALWPLFDTITNAWKTSSLPDPLLHSFENLFRSLPAGTSQDPITDGSKNDERAVTELVGRLSKRIKPPKSQPDADKSEPDDKN